MALLLNHEAQRKGMNMSVFMRYDGTMNKNVNKVELFCGILTMRSVLPTLDTVFPASQKCYNDEQWMK